MQASHTIAEAAAADAAALQALHTIAEVAAADAAALQAIGALRVAVWAGEGSLNASCFPTGVWLDAEDTDASRCRHFVARATPGGPIIAACRLLLHASAASAASDRDVALFLQQGAALAFPCCDFGRLVVRADWRRRGIATALNAARLAAAREWGARTLITTASAANARLLGGLLHFKALGATAAFEDRPGTVFHALILQLPAAASRTLVFGGAGAIGRRLIAALLARDGPGSVVAALRTTPLPPALASQCTCVFNVDVCKEGAVAALFREHGPSIACVWNLAAPLSVETAADPQLARATTVGGMSNILHAMHASGVRKICFSDSIGSFGASAPREDAPASWLVAHPAQDPGSDYGVLKRECRQLLARFAAEHGFDTRWAVIPGVLHSDPSWGAGTTEYALDAILCAVQGRPFACPVPLTATLPMILAEDLIDGLVRLQCAERSALREPERGYCLAGFSFSAGELLALLRARHPSAVLAVAEREPASRFAQIWPNSICAQQAQRDLGFKARFGFADTVEAIASAHQARQQGRVLSGKGSTGVYA